MRRDDVIPDSKGTEHALRALGVAGLYLFDPTSATRRLPARTSTYLSILCLRINSGFFRSWTPYQALQKAFGNRAEISYSTRAGLSPYIRKDVETEAAADFLMAASQNPRARLLHIRDEIEGVAITVNGMSFEQYRDSYILRRTMERAAQIISEAAKALPQELLSRYGEAPWASIIAIGNVLRHEYQRIDDRRIWEIATVHLPALAPVVRRMIAELDD